MTALSFKLGSPERLHEPWLKLAQPEDQETLRVWRNAHLPSFYHQVPITPEDQKRWHDAYRHRPTDHMFMVMQSTQAIGCIGLRFSDRHWDLYNVIRGVSSEGSQGFMSRALAQVVEFALNSRPAPIQAEVLATNPALGWYLANHFIVVAHDERRLILQHQGSHPQNQPQPP